MNLKNLMIGVVAVALSAAAALPAAAAITYTYVGSWAVADGPLWSGDPAPASLSGQQTAALLFGGVASDYAISTIDSDVNNINFSAFLDGYGDTTYLMTPASQSFVGIAGASYADGPGNYSAYVFDHACGIHYCSDGGGENARNYAFLVSGAVPEPATWGLMLLGFGSLGMALRTSRRRQMVAA